MVERKIYSFNEKEDRKIKGEKIKEGKKNAKLNMDPEERLRRKRKRHSDTVTRFYYRNKERVLTQKRLRYLEKKGLSKSEVIGQMLKKRTDLSTKDIDQFIV